jgi:hypothetical protein
LASKCKTRAVVEMHVEYEKIETAEGSFDCVRLAPHFAQDDRAMMAEDFGFADDRRLTTDD